MRPVIILAHDATRMYIIIADFTFYRLNHGGCRGWTKVFLVTLMFQIVNKATHLSCSEFSAKVPKPTDIFQVPSHFSSKIGITHHV